MLCMQRTRLLLGSWHTRGTGGSWAPSWVYSREQSFASSMEDTQEHRGVTRTKPETRVRTIHLLGSCLDAALGSAALLYNDPLEGKK